MPEREDMLRRRRDAQRAKFRADVYRSLVDATNVLRKAPVLIEANRWVKTWSEQMLAGDEAKRRV